MTRTHVSLFAGIGAMDIAAERCGYDTTHCVEIDPFCRGILAKHFPGAALHEDVRAVGAAELGAGMDLLSGGFPCQDLSSAGKGAGLEGGRSGLWFEYLRIIRECRPKAVLIENVAVLKSRGLDVVVRGLAEAGYGCWWDCVPALAVGAPHLRDRIWITAVPFDRMPTLLPYERPYAVAPAKMPRSGANYRAGLWELIPKATIRMCKEAMGAIKGDNGVTWLTSIDSPLFPTPTVGDSRNSRNATAGRKPGSNHHSGTTLSDFARLFPTPRRSDGERGGRGDLIQVVRENKANSAHVEQRLWPTPHGMSHPDAPRAAGPSGNELGHAVNREARLWPTPSRADGDGGPGRSPKRTGGDNLRTAAAPGSLSPDWVEGLMGLPIGWTDPDCAATVQMSFAEFDRRVPRVAAGVPHRKQRLMACGNSLMWQAAATRLHQLDRLMA